MIFLGDIAIPCCVDAAIDRVPWDSHEIVIANLEGAYAPDDSAIATRLYNSPATVELIRQSRISGFTLANNHITDLGFDLSDTFLWLDEIGCSYFGAGQTSDTAARELLLEADNCVYGLLGFGWPVIGCRPATSTRGGVNELDPEWVLSSVSQFCQRHPRRKLVLFMHWNYELELYPQPMHRQLALAAVDAGASAVIGCHSHCVQGIEYHRGAPIVYGLGNWYVAEDVFKRGTLRFPAFAHRQLAFDWRGSVDLDRCHFFDYEPNSGRVIYSNSIHVSDAGEIDELSPFRGMNHAEYIAWFKRHRRKRKLLPIYANYQSRAMNYCYDRFVGIRHIMIELALAARLKGGPR